MYISGLNSPVVNIIINNADFTCNSFDFCNDQAAFGGVYDNLKLVDPVLIGGLFHFDDGVSGMITSSFNTFSQCYSTREGAVWYLIKGLNLEDTGS